MARTPSNPSKPTTQLNTWDEILAKKAQVAAKVESKNVERPFLNLGNGQMTFQGQRLPNDEIVAILLADIHTNLYYEHAYDANNPVPPDCYALARVDEEGNVEELLPHADSSKVQAKACDGCPHNEWGSGNGRGKACQNCRRIALIPAGTIVGGQFQPFTTPEQIEDAMLTYLKLSVTNVKGYSGYVTNVANGLQRPVWAVYTKIKRVPSTNQYELTYDTLAKVPNNLLDAVSQRVAEAEKEITFPFAPKPANAVPLQPRKPLKRKYS